AALPVAIADHRNRVTVRDDVVLGRDRAAGNWRHAEQREVVTGDELSVSCRFQVSINADVHPGRRPCGQFSEPAGLLAHDPVLLVGEATRKCRAPAVSEEDEAFGVFHWQRSPHDGIDQAEDRGVGADPKREREHDRQGEDWTLPQQANRVAEIIDEGFKQEHGASLESNGCRRDRRLRAAFSWSYFVTVSLSASNRI